ncbi:MAG TPA: hypothetical protein VGB37_03870 [Candidatus Lokiarchaeia archaeon]
MTTLDLTNTANGIFSLVFICLSTIVGLKVAHRYLETKKTTPLWIGIAWIIIPSPWYGSAASFLVALITGNGLDLRTYIFIANFLPPFYMIFLIAAFTDFYYNEKQKLFVLISFIVGIIFEIYIIYYVIVDPKVIGELHGIIDIEYKGIWRMYLVVNIILICIIGISIAINSLESKTHDIRLRGIFLLLAFVSFTIGAFMDAALPLSILTLTIARILLISSAIEFYFGFVLPKWFKEKVLKEVN